MIIVDDTVSVHPIAPPPYQLEANEIAQRTTPPYLLPLTYISLGFSILPFILALINIPRSLVHTIPVIISYVLTAPFHVATLFVMWNTIRKASWQPFDVTSRGTLSFTIFLQVIWLFSAAMSSLMAAGASLVYDFCDSQKCQIHFTLLTVLVAFEVLLLDAMIIVIALTRRARGTTRCCGPDSTTSSTVPDTPVKGPRMMGN